MNWAKAALVAVATVALTSCGGKDAPTSSGPSNASPSKTTDFETKLGKPFVNGSFEITVTKIEVGVRLIDVDATAKLSGVKAYKPERGQFVIVYAEAKNVGDAPASMSSRSSSLRDADGTRHPASGPFLGGAGQHFDQQQPPSTTRAGWIAFDVPASVRGDAVISVRSGEPFSRPTLLKLALK